MAESGPFAVGEKVLVPHTDKFYEAKIQKAQKREDGLWYYFLHYLGWNKKWDEWVEETGLRRPGESLEMGVEAAASTAGAPGSGPSAAAAPPATGAVFGATAAAPMLGPGAGLAKPKSKQRKVAAGDVSGGMVGAVGAIAMDMTDSGEQQLQVELPASLQKHLLDQYDAIHEDNKLVLLPRQPNVQQIFQQYVQYVRDKQGVCQAEEDLVAGLTVYFDKALYQSLLFKAERRQADSALAAGIAPSAIYGAEHLLRLVVKLPELLPHTGATGEALQLLMRRVEDLVTYMQIQAERIFLQPSSYLPSSTPTPIAAATATTAAATAATAAAAAAPV